MPEGEPEDYNQEDWADDIADVAEDIEELTDGVILAAQPHGSPTWFPCNDRPEDKATYRIALRVPAGYQAVANGSLREHRRGGSTETWLYEQTEPMSTYLATVQIGRYVDHRPAGRPASGPPTSTPTPCRRASDASTRWSTSSRGSSAPTPSPPTPPS